MALNGSILFLFQRFVAGVLSEDKLLTQPVANVPASHTLAQSYGTMDTTGHLEPVSED